MTKDLGTITLTVYRPEEDLNITVELRRFTGMLADSSFCFVAKSVDSNGRHVDLTEAERKLAIYRAKAGEVETGR
jgi:hypothetical protein